MSRLCGSFCWNDQSPPDPELITALSQSLSRGDTCTSWSDGAVTLVQSEWKERVTCPLPYVFQQGSCCIVADARLNTDTRADLCSISPTLSATDPDIKLIAAAYTTWGERCVDHLQGDYAFLIWDASARQLVAARSPMGLRPLVYHVQKSTIVFASEAKQLLTLPGGSNALNPAWVALWLTEQMDHWAHTPWEGITHVPPGHVLRVNHKGVTCEPFWSPSVHTPARIRSQHDAIEQFRWLLLNAVRNRLPLSQNALVDISGGLDSSSLASLAGHLRQSGAPLATLYGVHAYSLQYVEKDDRALSKLVSTRYAIPLHLLSYEEDAPPLALMPALHPWTDTPAMPLILFAHLYAHLWTYARQRDIRLHLRGDFGDQLSLPMTYLRTMLSEQRYGLLMRELIAWGRSPFPLSQVLFHGLKQKTLLTPNSAAPWFRPTVWQMALAQQQQDQLMLAQRCPDPLPRVLFFWMLRHQDYMAMHHCSARVGLDTVEPFTDLRLLEFLLGCPAPYQVRVGTRKYLLREAMRDLLPEPIRIRTSKGRMARLLFAGIARHHQILRELVLTAPDLLRPSLDLPAFAQVLDRVASGDAVDQTTLFSTLALVLWAHSLPWAGGRLSPGSGAFIERVKTSRNLLG